MNAKTLNWILLTAVVVLWLCLHRSCSYIYETKQIVEAQTSELEKTRNQLGEEVSKRLVIVSDYKALKVSTLLKDSLLAELQKRINKQTISLTMLKSQTTTKHTGAISLSKVDTVFKQDTIILYPEIQSKYQDEWEDYSISVNKDSIYHTHTMLNKFSIEQSYVRSGPFKPKQIQINITNLNPNTITVDVQSFLIKPKKENRALWLAGAFFAGMLFLPVLNR